MSTKTRIMLFIAEHDGSPDSVFRVTGNDEYLSRVPTVGELISCERERGARVYRIVSVHHLTEGFQRDVDAEVYAVEIDYAAERRAVDDAAQLDLQHLSTARRKG